MTALQHYLRLIKSLGTADGYNTKAPEHLHIDYAKDAYRASNKRDYVIQMVRWLCQQEAVDFFSEYLIWVCHSLPLTPKEPQSHHVVMQPSALRTAPRITTTIALHPSRDLCNMLASKIVTEHNASQFIPAVGTLL